MTFFESIKTVFRKYATFDGRASRPEFWWFALFSTLVAAALNALTLPFNSRLLDFEVSASSFSGFASLSTVWAIAVLLPSLAVTVRRLRDAGLEWAHILWILIPVAGVIVLIILLTKPSVAATGAPVATSAGAASTLSD